MNDYKYSIDDAKKIAEERGGKCLSEEYKTSKSKMIWFCNKCKKTWEAKFCNIKNNETWCPNCASNLKHTIDDAKKIAEQRDGKCISEIYINKKLKLLWYCNKCKKTWESVFDSILRGSWCPARSHRLESNKKLNIDTAKKLAEKLNGKCISEKYVNNK